MFSKCQGVNFINILLTNILYKHQFGIFCYISVTRKKLPKQRSYEIFGRLTLMKLTVGVLLLFFSLFEPIGAGCDAKTCKLFRRPFIRSSQEKERELSLRPSSHASFCLLSLTPSPFEAFFRTETQFSIERSKLALS